MADHPELQAKLQELDHELEEGDITHKGSVSASPPPVPPLPLPSPMPIDAPWPVVASRHVTHPQRSALTTRTAMRSAGRCFCRST